MVPVAEQGASSSTASNSAGGRRFTGIGTDRLGRQSEPREIGGEALEADRQRSTAVTRACAAASCARLAARRGAEIEDPRPRDLAEQPNQQCRRLVLDPPLALAETRQILIRPRAASSLTVPPGDSRPPSSAATWAGSRAVRSSGGWTRWLAAIACAISTPKAAAQRSISHAGGLREACILVQKGSTAGRHLAQHRIDEAAEMARARLLAGEPHREVDHRMRRGRKNRSWAAAVEQDLAACPDFAGSGSSMNWPAPVRSSGPSA